MNMIFDKVEIMEKFNSIDTVEKFDNFEKEVNDYINGIINDKNIIDDLNKNYQNINNDLLSFNPQSMKEIIQVNFDPSIYDKSKYPDINYYSKSNNNNFNSFVDAFNLSEENML